MLPLPLYRPLQAKKRHDFGENIIKHPRQDTLDVGCSRLLQSGPRHGSFTRKRPRLHPSTLPGFRTRCCRSRGAARSRARLTTTRSCGSTRGPARRVGCACSSSPGRCRSCRRCTRRCSTQRLCAHGRHPAARRRHDPDDVGRCGVHRVRLAPLDGGAVQPFMDRGQRE